jgi:hypothetical protein
MMCDILHPTICMPYMQALLCVKAYLLDSIKTRPDTLADSDRSFSTLSRMLDQLHATWCLVYDCVNQVGVHAL